MQEFTSCLKAMQACVDTQTFSIAHLSKEEATLEMHIHPCYELYYSISGGKQFLIDNKLYAIAPGDLFFINQYESHRLTDVQTDTHERIIVYFHPDFTKKCSSGLTDLDRCFAEHPDTFLHKVSLNFQQQERFLYLLNKITSASGYGSDITEHSAALELLVLLNTVCESNTLSDVGLTCKFNHRIDNVLDYINQNIKQNITLEHLADYFFLSQSYLCRAFKKATGTTVTKYIETKRMLCARQMILENERIIKVYTECGFQDYSTFYRAYQRYFGHSPRQERHNLN